MNKDFWNQAYEEDAGQSAVPDFFIEEEAAALVPGSALDLGCGTGHIALKLASQGWEVTGVDFAGEAVRLANEAARERGLPAVFIAADSTTWQAPQLYDLVVSTFAMPEGDGMKLAAATMAAALKAGGTLIICEWDKKMTAVWGFGDDDLHSLDAYVAALPGLNIEVAETRGVPDPFAADEAAEQEAFVSFIRATKPLQA